MINAVSTAISRGGKTISALTTGAKCVAWKIGCRTFTSIMGFLPTLLIRGSPATVADRTGTGIAIGSGNGIGTATGIGIGERTGTVIETATANIGTRTSVFPVKIRAASIVIFSAGKTTGVPTTATK